MADVILLKLGGSLITDKTSAEAVRIDAITRLAQEIREALSSRPEMRLIIGHGSGSFGHVAADRHGTRLGVRTTSEWLGFAEVSDAAARLNSLVRRELLAAGVPALTFQPSASAYCAAGEIVHLAIDPIVGALDAGLVPVVYGDVAFDSTIGGTIMSTEEILSALAIKLKPRWLLLAGEAGGVYGAHGDVIAAITPDTLPDHAPALAGSHGTDVTGGMATKVTTMVRLAEQLPGLRIRIFSGSKAGEVRLALIEPEKASGTLITAPRSANSGPVPSASGTDLLGAEEDA
jgi:isopentenyl phosphate kinase